MTVVMKVRFKIKEEEIVKWIIIVNRVGFFNNDEKNKKSSYFGKIDYGLFSLKFEVCSLFEDIVDII